MTGTTLDIYLDSWCPPASPSRAVADTLRAIAGACKTVAWLVADGPLGGDLGAAITENVQGEVQKALDLKANDLLVGACARAPVFAVASEEMHEPILADHAATLLVAFDPLDGSSNIEVNMSIGTIFSILPKPAQERDLTAMFLQPGRNQLAAGYVLYGPQTMLVLTVGQGTAIFTLDRRVGDFVLTQNAAAIPADTREFAINSSNARHWSASITRYVEACLAGTEGPRGRDTNMRWIASLVAECHRILMRGGVFLYPADDRPAYAQGRLRVLYEAAPLAWLVEQAGGAATAGDTPILDISPRSLHQRTPFIFGSRAEVETIQTFMR